MPQERPVQFKKHLFRLDALLLHLSSDDAECRPSVALQFAIRSQLKNERRGENLWAAATGEFISSHRDESEELTV